MMDMDDRLKRKIRMFNIAGAVNLFLGFYVAFAGPSSLPRDTMLILIIFFFGFAAADFYLPYMMKKKWLEEQAKLVEGKPDETA